jgi:predicted nucleotidyltransferase/predicted transcriptional regulator
MGKNMNRNQLCSGLFGKTRQAVLALLYGQAGSSFYTKQILDAIKSGRGTVQRELKSLTDAGIITREVQGRQVYYRANEKCLIFNELKSIVRKTFGVSDVLREPFDTVSQRFRVLKPRLAEYCRRHHIKKLALFGSVLREDFHPDSDIDVLVEFEPGHVPGFGIIDMENELSRLVGHKVDLRTPGDLSRYFRDNVLREAKVEYAKTRS